MNDETNDDDKQQQQPNPPDLAQLLLAHALSACDHPQTVAVQSMIGDDEVIEELRKFVRAIAAFAEVIERRVSKTKATTTTSNGQHAPEPDLRDCTDDEALKAWLKPPTTQH